MYYFKEGKMWGIFCFLAFPLTCIDNAVLTQAGRHTFRRMHIYIHAYHPILWSMMIRSLSLFFFSLNFHSFLSVGYLKYNIYAYKKK